MGWRHGTKTTRMSASLRGSHVGIQQALEELIDQQKLTNALLLRIADQEAAATAGAPAMRG